jgi:hypothetical protein
LKQLYDETKSIKIPVQDHALASWLSRQKKLLNKGLLDPTHKNMLFKVGVRPSNDHTRKKAKNQELEEKWELQYQKLKEYHRIKGDCKVPRHWKEDRSLGIWLYN